MDDNILRSLNDAVEKLQELMGMPTFDDPDSRDIFQDAVDAVLDAADHYMDAS